MSVGKINIVPPQLEISTSITKQMFNLEKTLIDKLISNIGIPENNNSQNTTNLDYLDLYKGKLVDIYV